MKTLIDPAELVGLQTAARLLNTSRMSVHRLATAGAMAHVMIDGKRYFYRRDLERIAKQRKQTTA